MERLSLVAIVTAKLGHKDFVRAEIEKLIPITRLEAGCLNYNLYEDNQNPNRFVLLENWESHALWQDHMNSEHMKRYSDVTRDAVENWELIELTEID